MELSRSKRFGIAGGIAALLTLGVGVGAVSAHAITIGSPSNTVGQAAFCINPSNHTSNSFYGVPQNLKGCASGQVPVDLRGLKSGSVDASGNLILTFYDGSSITVPDVKPAPTAPIPEGAKNVTLNTIGGPWKSGHTLVEAVPSADLPDGTYLVTLTGDFYKTTTTTATPVLQIQLNDTATGEQVTGYTGAFPYNAAERTGLSSDGTPAGLEQTATAYGIVNIDKGATVQIDAFGYNPDTSSEGSGDFAVNATAIFMKIGS